MHAERTSGEGAGGAGSAGQGVHRGREGRASRVGYELLRFFAGLVIPIVAKLRPVGLANVPREGGLILAPNHIAWMDIPLVAYPIPRVTHFMAKAELFQVPLLGGFIRFMGAFPVRRGESDREALRTAERLLAEGEMVAIFPEGHRSEGRALIEAHTGVALIAMRAGVPVVPVAIWGSEQTLRRWRYFFARPTVNIRYGAPIRLEAAGAKRTSADIKRCTDEIMGSIAGMLPPRYRGVYAHLVPGATPGGVSSAGAEQPAQTPEPSS
jgi:1-acyl-sn-glycerol-3-phosphate acyltransferase